MSIHPKHGEMPIESRVMVQCIAELRAGLDITRRRQDQARRSDGARARASLPARPPWSDGAPPRADAPVMLPDATFGTALRSLLPKLKRFALRFTRSTDEAEDVVQAACERALLRFEQFEPGTRLDSWMFRIVQTICIDRARSERTRPNIGDAGELDVVPVDARICEQVAAGLDLDRLRRSISTLPREQRQVLALIVTEEMTYQEVAEFLKIPIGTVMSRLSRARLQLRSELPAH